MRRLIFNPVLLLPFFVTLTVGADDLSFCYGENSICSVGNDLYDLCSQYISADDESWYQCLCGNGYISTDKACHDCQLSYGLEEIYTNVTELHCSSVGIPIAPIPSSVLSVESNYNATYTGIISGATQTAAPTDTAASTTDGGGGISVPPQTTDPYASATATAAATSSSEDTLVVTQTVPSSTHKPTSTSASSSDSNNPVSKSSSGGLSTGAKAGIAIGAVGVAALIGALIWLGIILSRSHKRKAQNAATQQIGGQHGQYPPLQTQNVIQNPPGMAELGPGEGPPKNSLFGFYGKKDTRPQQQQQVPTSAYTQQNMQNQGPPLQYQGQGPPMQNQPLYGQPPLQNQSPPMQNTFPSPQNSTMSPVSQGRESSLGWPGGQTISPIPSPGSSSGPSPPIAAAAVYNQPPPQQQQHSPSPQNQYQYPPPQQPQQQSPPPQNQYYPPPQELPQPQPQQDLYHAYNPNPPANQNVASELQGSYPQPPGAGMPPDGRVG